MPTASGCTSSRIRPPSASTAHRRRHRRSARRSPAAGRGCGQWRPAAKRRPTCGPDRRRCRDARVGEERRRVTPIHWRGSRRRGDEGVQRLETASWVRDGGRDGHLPVTNRRQSPRRDLGTRTGHSAPACPRSAPGRRWRQAPGDAADQDWRSCSTSPSWKRCATETSAGMRWASITSGSGGRRSSKATFRTTPRSPACTGAKRSGWTRSVRVSGATANTSRRKRDRPGHRPRLRQRKVGVVHVHRSEGELGKKCPHDRFRTWYAEGNPAKPEPQQKDVPCVSTLKFYIDGQWA